MTEAEILARYSTPGLRKHMLDRGAKKLHLQGQGVRADDIEKILAQLYRGRRLRRTHAKKRIEQGE